METMRRYNNSSSYSEVAAGAVSVLVMTLEMMLTTLEANALSIFATFTSSFTFVTTFDSWEMKRSWFSVCVLTARSQRGARTPTSSLDSLSLEMSTSCSATSAALSAQKHTQFAEVRSEHRFYRISSCPRNIFPLLCLPGLESGAVLCRTVKRAYLLTPGCCRCPGSYSGL